MPDDFKVRDVDPVRLLLALRGPLTVLEPDDRAITVVAEAGGGELPDREAPATIADRVPKPADGSTVQSPYRARPVFTNSRDVSNNSRSFSYSAASARSICIHSRELANPAG